MNNDERFDEIIRAAASDYNRPPETPRDDMWTAIQAARATAAAGPQLRVVSGGASAGNSAPRYESAPHRLTPRYAWFGLAAAAALLVATGVGIGRWSNSGTERRIADAPALNAPVVKGDGIVEPELRDVDPMAGQAPSSGPAEAAAAQPEAETPASGRTRDEIRRNPIVTGQGMVRRVANDTQPVVPTNTGEVQAVSYQFATQQHLKDAETLLTSFTLESRDERMNTQFAGWAKGLLSNTRLLLDSPAGDDPRRAKLLQDLELVLAQIVQLSPEAPAADRELVQGSIQNGLVMTRLRAAIPADGSR
jgi:hypothetical protein